MNSQQAQQALSVLGSSAGAAAISKLVMDQLSDWVVTDKSSNMMDSSPKTSSATPGTHTSVAFAQGSSIRGSRSGGRSSSRRIKTMPINKSDLSIKPPSARIPTNVPAQIANALFWDVTNVRSTQAYAAGLTESNFAFSLASHPKVASLQAIFDQWTIPLVSVTWINLFPPGAAVNLPELHTAIDFDGIATLGSLAAIDQYDTVIVTPMADGKKYTRSVRPANVSTLTGGSGNVPGTWCDVATPSVNFNGIRSIINATSAFATGAVVVEYTCWFAFRGRR